ncbi:hypothetical protein AALB39_25925 [Lachnospiraceae bacterium 54-53]
MANVCDIPKHHKQELKRHFVEAAKDDDKNTAISIQTGLPCIESAIRDYIERYAYPFKVRDLMNTFDVLLKDVSYFIEFEEFLLQKKLEDLGKDTSEKEEVEKEKEVEENRENNLIRLKKLVEEQKKAIDNITFDDHKLIEIRRNFTTVIESDSVIESVRKTSSLSKEEISKTIDAIYNVFSREWSKANSELETFANEYKNQLQSICQTLKVITQEMQKGEGYNWNGYNYSNSLGMSKVKNLDANSLRKQVEDTKETIKQGEYKKERNPIKDEFYEWWQFIKLINQTLAPDKITKWVETEKEVYNTKPLQEYLTTCLADFWELCKKTQKSYEEDFKKLKDQAQFIADDIINDVEETNKSIKDYQRKINAYGNNIEVLNREVKEIEKRSQFLKDLLNQIEIGGK